MLNYRVGIMMFVLLGVLVSCSRSPSHSPESPPEQVTLGGFIDEQSRNVIIIMTDEQSHLATNIAASINTTLEQIAARRGINLDGPLIRGDNASLLNSLVTQQFTTQQLTDAGGTTPQLFEFARESVVAVTSTGEVVADSPLVEVDDGRSVKFSLDIPVDETLALLVAEPDRRGGWICKTRLEYQTLEGQRTVTSEQALYRFRSEQLSGEQADDVLASGRFQLNERTANVASRLSGDSNTMQGDLPEVAVQDAIVPLANAPDFAGGSYDLCNNSNALRTNVQADLNWQGDIFEVGQLPEGASPDLAQGEAALYDFAVALVLEPLTTQDEAGNVVSTNRLVGSGTLDATGNLTVNLVRDGLTPLDARLVFVDIGYFDARKRRFPLTPSFEFDVNVQAGLDITGDASVDVQQAPDDNPDIIEPDIIDLGELDNDLAYISGQVLTEDGSPSPQATVVMVATDDRLAFNTALTDDDGFYELFIPASRTGQYVLFAQDATVTFAGVASNEDTNIRYEVPDASIIDQDIILTDFVGDVVTDAPIMTDAGRNVDALLGDRVYLQAKTARTTGDVTLTWQVLDRPAGSTATLTTPEDITSFFMPDVLGEYTVQLSVTDAITTDLDTLTIQVRAPDANSRPPLTVCSGTFMVVGQRALDMFQPCEVIQGLINVRDPNVESDSLLHLRGLANLQYIEGDLTVNATTLLPSLDGLGKLREVEGDLFIVINAGLRSLEGIGALTRVGGNLFVFINNSLPNMVGLDSLTTIDGYALISVNAVMENLVGLESLTTIGDDLQIEDNAVMTSLKGLSGLVSIGDILEIAFNPRLESLEGLNNLQRVDGDLSLVENANIRNFAGLGSLIEIGGYVYVVFNDALENFVGLGQLSQIEGGLLLERNNSLVNFEGLDNLTTVGQGLGLNYHPSVRNFRGLEQLETIGESLIVGYNDSLENFEGLENLQTIAQHLGVGYNPRLESLQGLNNVTTLGGYLSITDNTNLANLEGLDNLVAIAGTLNIYENPALKSLAGLNQLAVIGRNVFINDNPVLESVADLAGVTFVGRNIYIANNDDPQFTSLRGLQNIQNYDDSSRVTVIDNDNLDCRSPRLPFIVDRSTGNAVDCVVDEGERPN
jgi:acyl-[acyl carrier protein]--UDP-N-acetylglucosamine O-acyltransferase